MTKLLILSITKGFLHSKCAYIITESHLWRVGTFGLIPLDNLTDKRMLRCGDIIAAVFPSVWTGAARCARFPSEPCAKSADSVGNLFCARLVKISDLDFEAHLSDTLFQSVSASLFHCTKISPFWRFQPINFFIYLIFYSRKLHIVSFITNY